MEIFREGNEPINERKIIDSIRLLAVDMINEAKSGHPGIALDLAPAIYTVYANHLSSLQLRIADLIARAPDGENNERHVPEIARIIDNQLVIEEV